MATRAPPERTSLDAFVDGLDDEAAADARVAAARIDDLAHAGIAVAGIERRFAPWAILGAAGFVAGFILFFQPGLVPRTLIMALLAILPLVCGIYAWKVRHRTRADNEAEALNKSYFLPHGGIYFPPGDRPACVMRVSYTPPPGDLPLSQAPRDPRKGHDTRPGRIW